MEKTEKVKGFKVLEISYVHPSSPHDLIETFEPVTESSIEFGSSWLKFQLADINSLVCVPNCNIIEIWMRDWTQKKRG